MSQEKWKLEVIQGDCGICDLCALACSTVNVGIQDPLMSAIKVKHHQSGNKGRFEDGPGILPCWHCDDPPCLPACPYDAMEISEHNVVSILDNCTACMKCVKACKEMHGESSIFISPIKDRIMKTKTGREIKKYSLYKCNMCEGDPACVKICPRNAIKFIKTS